VERDVNAAAEAATLQFAIEVLFRIERMRIARIHTFHALKKTFGRSLKKKERGQFRD